jgi:hypothetical protein
MASPWSGVGLVAFGVSTVLATVAMRLRRRAPTSDADGPSNRRRSTLEVQTLLHQDTARIYKFVLTGGPCSGKTTAMERIQVFLRERGFRVFVAVEAATLLFLNGASVDDFALPGAGLAFQNFVIGAQMTLEDKLAAYARAVGKNAVVLCDRGVMDGSAYVDDATWKQILANAGIDDNVSAREGRYDAVFHLVTAANGAERFYTLDNNLARSEVRPDYQSSSSPSHVPCYAVNRPRRKPGKSTRSCWLRGTATPATTSSTTPTKRSNRRWSRCPIYTPQHVHITLIIASHPVCACVHALQLVGLVAQSVGLPVLARRTFKYLLRQSPQAALLALPNVQARKPAGQPWCHSRTARPPHVSTCALRAQNRCSRWRR